MLHQKAVSEERCMHTHTHLQKHACTSPCTPARTHTHGCTITCPTSSVTSKAHSPSWYLILYVHVDTHRPQTHTHTHCLSPTKTFSACESCLETRKGGISFAPTGHVPWQLHPDREPVGWDMCGTLTQWQRSYWSSDLITKEGLLLCPFWHSSCQLQLEKARRCRCNSWSILKIFP